MIRLDRGRAPWRAGAALLLAAGSLGGAAGGDAHAASHDGPAPAIAAPAGPDVFGTVALAVDRTRYDQRWRRAIPAAGDPSLERLTRGIAAGSRQRQLFQVQAAVNRAIAFRADLDAHGSPDHWATAAETLSAGSGDCEDIAILKLEALRRLGFAAADLYLSIGRDTARGDHALALVRVDGAFWVLDNLRGEPVPADAHPYFEPMFTLSEGRSWLHGRRVAAASGGGSALGGAR